MKKNPSDGNPSASDDEDEYEHSLVQKDSVSEE